MGFFDGLLDFFGSDEDPQGAADFFSWAGGWNDPKQEVTFGREYDWTKDDGFTFGDSWGGWNN